ncbi:hypothetical protein BDQ17DRAFT_1343466 [Cyathus striatus]|nr:hypothetical protein BDQ17DRAFT_1343466 [Cyathus striatus]
MAYLSPFRDIVSISVSTTQISGLERYDGLERVKRDQSASSSFHCSQAIFKHARSHFHILHVIEDAARHHEILIMPG